MRNFTLLLLTFLGLAIQVANAQGGISCETAQILQSSGNYSSNNSEGDQWFKYTAKSNGKVTISSVGQTSVDTYVEVYNTCGEDPFIFSNDFEGKQSKVCFEVTSGLSYLISWRNLYTAQDFEWSLVEETISEGDFCSSPIIASAGSSTSTIMSGNYKWYQFTASKNGKITVEATGTNSVDCKIAIFDDCSYTAYLNNDNNWNPSIVAFQGNAGDAYLIALYNSGSNATFNWSIKESDWEQGERCSQSTKLDGSAKVTVDHSSGTDKWYSYTALKDGKLTISSANVTSEDTYLEVYEGCTGERIAFSDDAVGLQSELAIEVKSGQDYYIKWDNIFQPKQYAWNLKVGEVATSKPSLQSDEIGIYPNRSVGPVTIDLTGYGSETVTIKVLTLAGVPVKTMQLSGGERFPYDFSDLTNGMYHIVMEDLVSKNVIKFLKQ